MGISNCSNCRKGQEDKEEIIKAQAPNDLKYINEKTTNLIPEEANNFMIENAFDINKYLSENKENIE